MQARASFDAEPVSAAEARRFAERTLLEWELDDLLDAARLLVSELVINAVLHAHSASEVLLRRDAHCLRVEVSDTSREVPVKQEYSPRSPSGRGLLILDELSERWGVDVGESGKVVWFELVLDPTTARP